MAVSPELLSAVGSSLAFLLGLISLVINNYDKIKLLINKIRAYFSPYIQITMSEYGAAHNQPSDFFLAIEAYLSTLSRRHKVRKLRAVPAGRDSRRAQVTVDDEQEIIDSYSGATLRWYSDTKHPRSSTVISQSPGNETGRFYRVTFHRKFRDLILDSYLPQVQEKGRDIIAHAQRHLFTNNPSSRWSSCEDCWSHEAFEHPATFDKLAMDPTEKQAIIDDLNAFVNGKDYYSMVGKAWKRGYLLSGPPGTGKSMMIAAMANFLQYDVYDLDLTAVKDNTELRRLFVETKPKSIIVIENIDRFVNFTRDNNKPSSSPTLLRNEDKDEDAGTKVTLAGLLNVIDGLRSVCSSDSERIIIFTAEKKSRLDPALIRAGRMDMHIEMSYCRYEAFKVLASYYLHINGDQLFELLVEIQRLLEEVDMSPADVAQHLTGQKSGADACFTALIAALKHAKAVKDKEKAN